MNFKQTELNENVVNLKKNLNRTDLYIFIMI